MRFLWQQELLLQQDGGDGGDGSDGSGDQSGGWSGNPGDQGFGDGPSTNWGGSDQGSGLTGSGWGSNPGDFGNPGGDGPSTDWGGPDQGSQNVGGSISGGWGSPQDGGGSIGWGNIGGPGMTDMGSGGGWTGSSDGGFSFGDASAAFGDTGGGSIGWGNIGGPGMTDIGSGGGWTGWGAGGPMFGDASGAFGTMGDINNLDAMGFNNWAGPTISDYAADPFGLNTGNVFGGLPGLVPDGSGGFVYDPTRDDTLSPEQKMTAMINQMLADQAAGQNAIASAGVFNFGNNPGNPLAPGYNNGVGESGISRMIGVLNGMGANLSTSDIGSGEGIISDPMASPGPNAPPATEDDPFSVPSTPSVPDRWNDSKPPPPTSAENSTIVGDTVGTIGLGVGPTLGVNLGAAISGVLGSSSDTGMSVAPESDFRDPNKMIMRDVPANIPEMSQVMPGQGPPITDASGDPVAAGALEHVLNPSGDPTGINPDPITGNPTPVKDFTVAMSQPGVSGLTSPYPANNQWGTTTSYAPTSPTTTQDKVLAPGLGIRGWIPGVGAPGDVAPMAEPPGVQPPLTSASIGVTPASGLLANAATLTNNIGQEFTVPSDTTSLSDSLGAQAHAIARQLGLEATPGPAQTPPGQVPGGTITPGTINPADAVSRPMDAPPFAPGGQWVDPSQAGLIGPTGTLTPGATTVSEQNPTGFGPISTDPQAVQNAVEGLPPTGIFNPFASGTPPNLGSPQFTSAPYQDSARAVYGTAQPYGAMATAPTPSTNATTPTSLGGLLGSPTDASTGATGNTGPPTVASPANYPTGPVVPSGNITSLGAPPPGLRTDTLASPLSMPQPIAPGLGPLSTDPQQWQNSITNPSLTSVSPLQAALTTDAIHNFINRNILNPANGGIFGGPSTPTPAVGATPATGLAYGPPATSVYPGADPGLNRVPGPLTPGTDPNMTNAPKFNWPGPSNVPAPGLPQPISAPPFGPADPVAQRYLNVGYPNPEQVGPSPTPPDTLTSQDRNIPSPPIPSSPSTSNQPGVQPPSNVPDDNTTPKPAPNNNIIINGPTGPQVLPPDTGPAAPPDYIPPIMSGFGGMGTEDVPLRGGGGVASGGHDSSQVPFIPPPPTSVMPQAANWKWPVWGPSLGPGYRWGIDPSLQWGNQQVSMPSWIQNYYNWATKTSMSQPFDFNKSYA